MLGLLDKMKKSLSMMCPSFWTHTSIILMDVYDTRKNKKRGVLQEALVSDLFQSDLFTSSYIKQTTLAE